MIQIKMKYVSAICSLLFGLAMVSCSKNATSPSDMPSGVDSVLYGTWEWSFTTGGFGGWTYRPDSVKYECNITFSSPNLFKVEKNDQTLQQGTYSLVTDTATAKRYDYVLRLSKDIDTKLLRDSLEKALYGFDLDTTIHLDLMSDSLLVYNYQVADGWASLFLTEK